MKLTVLSENAVLYPGLEGEFGLSVYLEEGDTRLLFDAGERDACLRNAEKLGIDLRRVTAVAFSHNTRSEVQKAGRSGDEYGDAGKSDYAG